MRAILINPYAQTVTETELPEGDYKAIYRAISVPEHKVDCFTAIQIAGDDESGESLFLDDEGMLQPGRRVWTLDGYPEPLAGCGLILGCDAEGESVSTRLAVERVAALVQWTALESSGDIAPGRDATPEEARAMSHGLADHGWIGGSAMLQPAGTHKPG